ncbi:hypothetical protein OVA06_19450 [Pseudarthrobacter sp. SL88]|uniref:hypothetical protein n=1 Tax=Pseudarthrobacter sp. SL88 TaxID=2994666 RepID=UPI002273A45A|nr:hypothetical protein [Pseudarthrobacter sp. SL88]MCY1676849.1 hypothetical protein [Pseudarthrobacter sp. SL88]
MNTPADSAERAHPIEKEDTVSPWPPFFMGIFISAVAVGSAIYVYQTTGPVGPNEIGLLIRLTAFIAIVGVTLIGLGIYIRRTQKSGRIFYKLRPKDYVTLILQLLPGAALAALGNTLTPEFGWLSLGLGTAVSVLLVRRSGPKL